MADEENEKLENEESSIDPMEAIDLLSEALGNESLEDLEALKNDLEKGEASEYKPSLILSEESQLPKPKNQNIACIGCKNSLWFGSSKCSKCYCKLMFTITFDSVEMIDEITECDGREEVSYE